MHERSLCPRINVMGSPSPLAAFFGIFKSSCLPFSETRATHHEPATNPKTSRNRLTCLISRATTASAGHLTSLHNFSTLNLRTQHRQLQRAHLSQRSCNDKGEASDSGKGRYKGDYYQRRRWMRCTGYTTL